MAKTDRVALVRPNILAGAARLPLRKDLMSLLARAVVDTHVHLPDMFELMFLDPEGKVATDRALAIGEQLTVSGGAPDSSTATELITGEITAVECICDQLTVYTVIRGYEQAHRLQRARRTRTFVNTTDSDIARTIAAAAGLRVRRIDRTRLTHAHVAQIAQTDWEFLKQRAHEIGFEFGVAGGTFYFRRPPRGGAVARRISVTGSFQGQVKLAFGDDLLTFLPRVSAVNLTPTVEVRVRNAANGDVSVGSARLSTGSALLDAKPAELGGQFSGDRVGGLLRRLPSAGLGAGAATARPDPHAYVVVDRPVASGALTAAAADELAEGVAEHLASTFAEAEGYAIGNPKIQAGSEVQVEGVPEPFTGSWTITNARHVFDPEEDGYRTRFFVSGRHDRSLFGLASMGAAAATRPAFEGVVVGVVTNVADPERAGRVKLSLPWLDPRYESDWAQVSQPGAGPRAGALLMPEVGDEVLVGFEFGDVRRPIVLGGMLSRRSTPDLGGDPVRVTGAAGSVARRGVVSASGSHLVFHDELPPSGAAPPTAARITLGAGDGDLALDIDQVKSTVTISCAPAAGAGRAATGTLTIRCGEGGTINIDAGKNGRLNIDGGASLSIRADAKVRVESAGVLELKGQQVQIQGTPIKLN